MNCVVLYYNVFSSHSFKAYFDETTVFLLISKGLLPIIPFVDHNVEIQLLQRWAKVGL